MNYKLTSIILNSIFALTLPFFVFMSIFLTDNPNNPKRFTNGLVATIALHAVAVAVSVFLAWKQRGHESFRNAFWISLVPVITFAVAIVFVTYWSQTMARDEERRAQAFLVAPTTYFDPTQQYLVSVTTTKMDIGYQVFFEQRVPGKGRSSVAIGFINEKNAFVFEPSPYLNTLLPVFTNPTTTEEFLKSFRNSSGQGLLDQRPFTVK